jgi:hypothetical protein
LANRKDWIATLRSVLLVMTGGWKVPDVQTFFGTAFFKRAGSFLLVSGKAWMR